MHRLPATIALGSTGILGLTLLALVFIGIIFPLWASLATLSANGIGAYFVSKTLLIGRIDTARKSVEVIPHGSMILSEDTLKGDELQQLISVIHHTGQGVQRKMEELERLEHYRREFLGNVSHELKTPIFSIRGFAETLLQGALDDVSVRHFFVQKILNNASRLGHLAEDLDEVARIEMGELTMNMAPFNLRQVVHEVTESLEPLARNRQVTVSHTIADDLPPIHGDRERIQQVVSNLVDNAIKYSNTGGQVEVGARLLPDQKVKISVVDDGIGIAPEHIVRLTERFFRVDASRSRSQGGTGLGLAIVKHILGAHSSQLIVESKPERGSTFGFTLPTIQSLSPR